MPGLVETLRLVIDGNSRGAVGAVHDLTKATEKASRSQKAAHAAVGVGAGLAAGGLAAMFGIVHSGIGEVMDASKADAQLEAGIKSTKNAAHVTKQGLNDLASSIQDYSGQTDDSIAATEALLLTFTNIKNVGPDKIFDDTTRAAADMAAKMGGDSSRYAVQLGKALNDPVKGMTALQRVGVSFTEGQKKQVEQMVKTGDTIGAQKLILKELNVEFGGAAKAAGESIPGQVERAKRAFEDFTQGAVQKLVPLIIPTIEIVRKAIGGLTVAYQAVEEFFTEHGPAIKAAVVENFQTVWAAVGPTLINVATTIYGVVAAIVKFIQEHWNKIGPIVFGVLNYVKTYILSWFRVIRDIINIAMALLRGDWSAVWNGIKKLVVDVLKGIYNTIKAYIGMWKAIFSAGWAALVGIVRGAMSKAWEAVSSIGGNITEWITGLAGKIKNAAVSVLDAGLQLGKALVNGIISAWNMLDLKISIKIPGWVPGIGGKGWESPDLIPDVPLLAGGGLIRKPTLIVAGDNRNAANDPEVVAPLSKLQGMLGGAPLFNNCKFYGSPPETWAQFVREHASDVLSMMLGEDDYASAAIGRGRSVA